MAETAFAGAAVMTAFAAFYELIKVTTIKNVNFKPILKKITGTVETLKPMIDDIKELNEKLDLQPNEISGFEEEMKKGKDLFAKCSKVHRFNFCIKTQYFDELQDLDDSLNRWMAILKVQQVRDIKKNKEIVGEMHREFVGNRGNQAADN